VPMGGGIITEMSLCERSGRIKAVASGEKGCEGKAASSSGPKATGIRGADRRSPKRAAPAKA
jgi:hypothetical protein